VPNGAGAGIAGLVEKPDVDDAPSNLASIGRYVLTPDTFDTLRGLNAGSGGEVQLADAVSRGIMDAGADVLDIGLSGTEELYWATTEFAACGGIEVAASHNPINYNGMKMLKAGSKRLDPASELPAVQTLAEEKVFAMPSTKGSRKDIVSEAKSA
jgi:hypothetical protein